MKPAERYARDPAYGKPPSWSKLYTRFFPKYTDGCSRHSKMIADDILRDPKSPVRQMLINAGYEPDHWAQSIELTVKVLWETRAQLRALRERYEPEQLAAEEEAALQRMMRRLKASQTPPDGHGEVRDGEAAERPNPKAPQ